ncbi:AHH domain-containing protein [Pseudoalteromonas sp. ASV78]|uniref:AHH domain-containing protein n=1 Tax=Pseudoalteromonas sp. ASV78 TaxID=3397851 RepID=UPI0039FD39D2
MRQHANYPQPSRPSDPSPLELAIYNFELKAKSYYDAQQKSDDSEQLKKRLNQDYNHLQREKRRIESVAIAQNYLQQYRSDNEKLDVEQLLQEPHHPTAKLAKFLFATGEPQPTIHHEAHHIIAGKGRYLQPKMLAARLNMHLVGLGINDPFNGTWLINFERNKEIDWATQNAPAHRKLHRKNYETWISNNLGAAQGYSKAQFITKIRSVKQHIKTGTIPSSIFSTKNTELWKGL